MEHDIKLHRWTELSADERIRMLSSGFMMFANERDKFSVRSLHGPGLYITYAIEAVPVTLKEGLLLVFEKCFSFDVACIFQVLWHSRVLC